MTDQSPELTWHGDVPVAPRFDGPYFSLGDGLAETRHVFLAGNGLPERFRDGFQIAELGFGTGLNLFTALHAWRAAAPHGRMHFTSFERFAMPVADMTRALAVYPEIAALAAPILDTLDISQTCLRAEAHDLSLRVILGDARRTVPVWGGRADAWFLDGFSPAKNPEMWDTSLLRAVARHTRAQGTAATYSAAGHVRRGLADAGFDVARRPGYGRKRHMTVAQMP